MNGRRYLQMLPLHLVTMPNSLNNLPESVLTAIVQPELSLPPNSDFYDLGHIQSACIHCGAPHWISERKYTSTISQPEFKMFCLSQQVGLPEFTPPPRYLYELLHSPSPEATDFSKDLRAYDSVFAFTSLVCTQPIVALEARSQIYGLLFLTTSSHK